MSQNLQDFTTGSITKKLVTFMLPILAALILQAMYGAVDVFMVGRFGTTEGLSGVSTGSNIVNVITFIVCALTVGVQVVISQFLGEGRKDKLSETIGNGITFFFVLAVLLTIIVFTLARPIAQLMRAPAEALDATVSYMRICGAGLIFIVAYNFISVIFKGMGNSQLPLLFVGIACVVNIIGDFLFVAILKLDQAGAALATIMAQAVSVILSLVILSRQDLPFSISLSVLKPTRLLKRILQIGIPLALQETCTQISFLAIVAFINNVGLEASSGYGIASKIVSFIMLIPSSLMQSMSSFVGQNIGAGRKDRANRALITGMAIGLVIGVLAFYIAAFHGVAISGFFTSNGSVAVRSAEYLRGYAAEAVVTAVLFSFIGYFNGMGLSMFVMVQGLAQTLLIRLPLSYIMSIQPNPSLTRIGMAAPIATSFGIVINVVFFIYLKRNEKKRSIVLK